LNTWRNLYEVSHQSNSSTQRSSIIRSSLIAKPIKSDIKHPKYIFIITLSILIVLIINFFICILLAKRGHFHRKREYDCLSAHTQLNTEKALHQQRSSSSPTSTNSNGTITQHLIVHTNCATTNSSLSSTPPVDMLHPINVTKKNDILRRKTSFLPEAIV
jgi:hypothetical protein